MPEESDAPAPHTDPTPAEGPGGPDAVPDWEAAEENPVVPDQPHSAQVDDEDLPDELKEPEELDESDGAGSHPEVVGESNDPGDKGKETLTDAGDEPTGDTPA
jgi:hypothetical protein